MDEDLDLLAGRLNTSREMVVQNLKDHYDGYHFTWPSPDIYNPFSLLTPSLPVGWTSTGSAAARPLT